MPGRSGRRPLPTKFKLLKGESRPSRINQAEPEFDPADPTCPAWLTGLAREKWNDLAPKLGAKGVLTVVDTLALEAVCHAYGRWRDLAAAVTAAEKGGSAGASIASGLHGAALKERAAFLKALAEFGMTPSSRSKVHATPPKPATKLSRFTSGR